MTKPTTSLFSWTTATANRESPSAGKQVTGFQNGKPVDIRVLNGLLGNARDWLSWLIGAFRLTEDAGALETWIPDVDQSVVVPTSPASTSVVVQDVGAAYIAGALVEPSTTGDITVAIPIPVAPGRKQWHAIVMDADGDLQVLSLTQYTTPDPAPAFPDVLVNRATQIEIAWVRTFEGQTTIEAFHIVDRRQTRPISSASVAVESITPDRLERPPVCVELLSTSALASTEAGEYKWTFIYRFRHLDGTDIDYTTALQLAYSDYRIRLELYALGSANGVGREVLCAGDGAVGQKLYIFGDPPGDVPDWPGVSVTGGNPAFKDPVLATIDTPQGGFTIRGPTGEAVDDSYLLKITPVGPRVRGPSTYHFLTLTTP